MVGSRTLPLNDDIQFGGPTEQQKQIDRRPRLRPQKIIVLGAGVSGLACSRELKQRGHEVLVVEARSRVGGRLKGETLELGADYPITLPQLSPSTRRQQRGKPKQKKPRGGNDDRNAGEANNVTDIATTRQHPVDVGGALIHGIENNPIYQITSQMGVPVHPVSSYCLLMDENGWPFDPKLDERTSNFFNECLDTTFALAEKDRTSKDSFGNLFEKVCREKSGNGNGNATIATASSDKQSLGTRIGKRNVIDNKDKGNNNNWETPLLKWHRSNLELPSGASFYDLGHTWNEDEPYGFDGVHAAVEPSWNLVMEQLAEGLDIIGNSPVTDVRVVLPNGTTPLKLPESDATSEKKPEVSSERTHRNGKNAISNTNDDTNVTGKSLGLESAVHGQKDDGASDMVSAQKQQLGLRQLRDPQLATSTLPKRRRKKAKDFFDPNLPTRRFSRRQRNIDVNVRRSARSTKGVITRLEFDHDWDESQRRKRKKISDENGVDDAAKDAVKDDGSTRTITEEEEKVFYEPSSMVQITLRNGTVLEADALVSTLPLGVLKLPQNDPCHVRFVPSLDPVKKDAIQNLGCGLLNKCAISFENVFWQDSEFLGQANSHYSYLVLNATKYTQKPILIFMYGGDFAKDVEGWTDQEIVRDCLEVLKKICGGSREIPSPVDYCITRWGKEEFSRMAFTCIPPGVDGAAALRAIGQPIYDPMIPQKPLIMFAGEHTTPYHPSTMHGAFLSGIREAYRFDLFMEPVLNNHIKFDDQIHVYKHSFPIKRVYKKYPAVKKKKSKATSVAAESNSGASSSSGFVHPTTAAATTPSSSSSSSSNNNKNVHSRRRGFGGMTLRSRQEPNSTIPETTAATTTISRKSRQSVGSIASNTLDIPSAAIRRSQRSLGSVRNSIQTVGSRSIRSSQRTEHFDSLLDERKRAEKFKLERKKRIDKQEDRTLHRALESYGGGCYSLLQSHILPVYGSSRKRSAKQIIEKWRQWESLPVSVLSPNGAKGTGIGEEFKNQLTPGNIMESWRAKYIVRDNWNTHFARIAADAATEAASSENTPEEIGNLRRSNRGSKPRVFFGGE